MTLKYRSEKFQQSSLAGLLLEWLLLYRNLRYVQREKLSGDDSEETVDAIHRTDLGFTRIADGLARYIKL